MTSKEVTKLTDAIYKAYGTDSGILFGLPPHKRAIVEAIVTATLNCLPCKKLTNDKEVSD